MKSIQNLGCNMTMLILRKPWTTWVWHPTRLVIFLRWALDQWKRLEPETWDLRLAWKQLFPIADSRDRPQARQPQLCPGDQHGRDGGLPRRERVRALRCRRARQGGSRLPSQRLARQVLHQNLLLGFTSPFQYQVCGRGCWNPGVGPLSRGGGHCKGCLMSHHVLKTFHPHRCQDQRGHQGEVHILKVSHLHVLCLLNISQNENLVLFCVGEFLSSALALVVTGNSPIFETGGFPLNHFLLFLFLLLWQFSFPEQQLCSLL